MKRSNQLILESLVVASLLLGIVLGGSVSTSSLPRSWVSIQNPAAIQPDYNMTSLALFYSNTLFMLSSHQYQNVSQSLSTFQFFQISPLVVSTAQNANSEIASMNVSLPELSYYLNGTESLYAKGSLANATLALDSLCSIVSQANASLSLFVGPTTSAFNSSGVPVSIYHPQTIILQDQIDSYFQACTSYGLALGGASHGYALKITSDQTPVSSYGKLWVNTGGELNISASLEENGTGVSGQAISFHAQSEATDPQNITTNAEGFVNGTITLPYFYQPSILVWATAEGNGSIPFIISNVLNLTILYHQTQIIINDPPEVLPTFPFDVSGALKDNSSGEFLPNAPVRITSFGSSYFTTTDSSGVFNDTLYVPANASDGLHYIYADFAPKGAFGPSVNFTSITVYRLPVSLTITRPSVLIPGLQTTISGTVSANGSALSSTQIFLNTPWGIYSAATDSSGRYSFPLSVPLTDFGFNLQFEIVANPSQAYVSGASANLSVSTINLVVISIIVFAIGFGAFQARNLGIRSKSMRKGPELIGVSKIEDERALPSQIPSEILSRGLQSPIIRSYLEALALAEKKFAVSFSPSTTIRETEALISNIDNINAKKGAGFFGAISNAAEDYLYSEKRDDRDFIARETTLVNESLSELKSIWGKEIEK